MGDAKAEAARATAKDRIWANFIVKEFVKSLLAVRYWNNSWRLQVGTTSLIYMCGITSRAFLGHSARCGLRPKSLHFASRLQTPVKFPAWINSRRHEEWHRQCTSTASSAVQPDAGRSWCAAQCQDLAMEIHKVPQIWSECTLSLELRHFLKGFASICGCSPW